MDAVAARLHDAFASRQLATLPSAEDATFDLAAGYAVEHQLVEGRRRAGRRTVGVKVGYANKAVWRALKLETLVWAHMYDDTVRYAEAGAATLSVARMIAPRIEPEIIFRLARQIAPGADAAAALAAVEWLALGFEIVDSPYAPGPIQPGDFVAAYGFHAALVVGEPLAVNAANIPALLEQLPGFTVRLLENDALAAEGSGKNVLRSPALCLAELASAMPRQPGAETLVAGDLVSSGSLSDAQPIAGGEIWRAEAHGIPLTPVSVRLE
jgi:2-oxo-3-hexenedioate decarboxylase